MRDKVIVVFGGAGGIGAEVGVRLASDGALVVIADLDAAQARAQATVLGGRAIGVACDITFVAKGRRQESITVAMSDEWQLYAGIEASIVEAVAPTPGTTPTKNETSELQTRTALHSIRSRRFGRSDRKL